jgi:hypothetical protein
MVGAIHRQTWPWLLALLATWAQAAPPENFRFFPQPVEIPERGEVISYVLLLGTNRFSFLPPPHWQLRYEAAERKAVLTSRDLAASMTLKIVLTNQPGAAPLAPEPLRLRVLESLPEARILREFPCYTSALKGLAFDLERVAGNRTKLVTRQAYVPFGAGMLELSLTTPASRFPKFKSAFSSLLTSFRIELSNPRGAGSSPRPPSSPQTPAEEP